MAQCKAPLKPRRACDRNRAAEIVDTIAAQRLRRHGHLGVKRTRPAAIPVYTVIAPWRR
jgi:hypothetical protein